MKNDDAIIRDIPLSREQAEQLQNAERQLAQSQGIALDDLLAVSEVLGDHARDFMREKFREHGMDI